MPRKMRILAASMGLSFVACMLDTATERGYARYLGEATGEEAVDGAVELVVLENYCGAEVYTPEDMEFCLQPSPAGPGFTDRWDEFEPVLFGDEQATAERDYDTYDEGGYADEPYGDDEYWSYEDEYYEDEYYEGGGSAGAWGSAGASGAVAVRRPRTYVMSMTPLLAVGLVVAATATAPVSVPAASLLLLGGALIALRQPLRSVYTPLGPGLMDALWHDVVPTERDASISGSVAQAVERTATRARPDRCARPVPRTVSAGGTVSVVFCAIPGEPLRSDTSSIAVIRGVGGSRINVMATAVGRLDLVAVMDFARASDRLATQVQTAHTLPATLTVPLRPGRLMQLQGYSAASVPMFTYVPVTAQ